MIKKNNWLNVLSLSFIVIWLILASVPFLWTLWGSFKVELIFSQSKTGVTLFGVRTLVETGGIFTLNGYKGAGFRRILESSLNNGIVTVSVVTISYAWHLGVML